MHALQKEIIALNGAQDAAARAPMGPLLIVAGAGTGKTRTLTSRMAYFIEQGMRPERICAITFTNKAAKEMADRVARMIPGESGRVQFKNGPLISTFHSLGARILRKECQALGRDFNFTIFDDHDSFDLVKKILKPVATTEDTAVAKKETPSFFIEQISKSKNLETSPTDEAAMQNHGGAERVALVVSGYEKALQENNAFDFDDLIEKVVALFKSNPRILGKYQTMFDAVLVDEYQDINPKQHEFIKLLAGKHRNLSAVGDDEQTIYGWRYADIKIFLNFEREWPGARVYFLEENYRSTGSIIRGASGVVKNNRLRAPKNLYTKNPDGEPISLFEAWSEGDEAERIVEEVCRRDSEGNGETVAVLYRTNAQSRAIEQALIRRDIPYRIFGGLKFYERREIKDAVAGLRYAANPRDTVSRERLEKNLTKRKFAAFRGRLGELAGGKPIEVLNVFLETYDYLQYLADNFTNVEERQENIAELSGFVGGFDDMSELLQRLSLLQATDDENRASEGGELRSQWMVNLMTVHLAKGLEYDAVFVIGVAEGLMPHVRSMDSGPQVEEERRLMYVAMTRARKKLFLSFYGMPSRFIGEIPQDCIALQNGTMDQIDADVDDGKVIYF